MLITVFIGGCGIFEPSPGNVEYNGNGATSGKTPVDSKVYRDGATVAVRDNTGRLKSSGRKFAGWSTSASGLGPIYGGGSKFAMGGSKATLYAIWIPAMYEFWSAEGAIGIFGCENRPEGRLVIPPYVTEIGDSAFIARAKLADIEIPPSVRSIGSCAFYFCSGLTSVAISASVRSIGSCAFYFCSSLTGVAIPPSVASIESCTFNGCTSLTSVTIPGSVRAIKQYAFYGCTSLASVTEQAITPPSLPALSGAFSNASPKLRIHVPYSSDGSVLAAYKTAQGWSDYADIIISP
jgi:hypothetical protein